VQLIAKNVIKPEEWEDISSKIKYDYLEDNHYSELKDAEILAQRVQILQQLDPYVGKYYSQTWIRKNVLRLDDEDIKTIEQEIEKEKEDHLDDADQQGTLAGVTQAAQQNYLQQNAPQAVEAGATDGPVPSATK
jgi:membrane-associated HD superfamily phosphohydrolase